MTRRDLLLLWGAVVMDTAVRPFALSNVTAGEHRPARPDVWGAWGLEQLRKFVRLDKEGDWAESAVQEDVTGVRNLHALHVKAESALNGSETFKHLFRSLVPKCGLDGWEDWLAQDEFFGSVVGQFFRGGGYDLGSYCVNTLWKSGRKRFQEDNRLDVAINEVRVEYFDPGQDVIFMWPFGDLSLHDIRWGYKRDWEDAGKIVTHTRLAKITIRRVMRYPVYRHHTEVMVCRALPEDHETLVSTRIPGEADINSDRTDDLRATTLVGLHKVYGLKRDGPNAVYDSLDLELDPAGGRLISLRGTRACLASSLARMPVEHRALRAILERKVTW